MTTMDSDSESQDSDDGRRFRFEATRKDSAAHVEPSNKSKSSRKKAKHKSRTHRDRKEKSKYESSSGRKDSSRSSKDRDANDKDLRHAIKQPRSSLKHEDGKTAHKDHRESFDSKDRRDSKRYRGRERDRDRSSHHKQRSRERSRDRSRERSHDRNHEDQSDRHRSRCGDRSKYHSRKSRDRSSNKHRSPESDRSRDGRHDARRTPKKEVKPELKESVRRSANDESHSNDRADNQDCKDIDLSDYDVLSETDENMSDASDSPSRSPHYHKSKIKKRDPDEGSEGLRDSRQAINSDHRSGEVLHKVNPRNSEPTMSSSSSSGSSNNNPSAVSDFLLGSASSATSARAREYMNNDKEMAERCGTKDKPEAGRAKLVSDSTDDESRLCYSSLDEDAESRENNKKPDSSRSLTDTDGSTYGPALPPKLASDPYAPLSSSDEKWTDCRTDSQPGSRLSPVSQPKCDSSEECDGKSAKGRAFIGPCLPETDTHEEAVTASKEALSSSRNSVYRSDSDNEDVEGSLSVDQDASGSSLVSYKDTPDDGDVAFGPALPPHLLQKSQDRIIGPAMPDNVESCMVIDCVKSSDSEDDDAIGPLPMDHPALRSSLVHEQLEHRAKKIKDQLQDETENVASKREEWMTELPSARASNLGLAARKFRVNPAPDMSDRSCWTDTPAQKAQKLKEQALKKSSTAESEKIPVSKVAKEDSGSRKREKSLLEVHQDKLQKKKKKEEKEGKSEERTYRRPFDRDIDLQANRLDKVQKKAIFMKAQLLNDRFSRGEI